MLEERESRGCGLGDGEKKKKKTARAHGPRVGPAAHGPGACALTPCRPLHCVASPRLDARVSIHRRKQARPCGCARGAINKKEKRARFRHTP